MGEIKQIIRFRSSSTGEFVTEAYALRNPSTTQRDPMDVEDAIEAGLLHIRAGIARANAEDLAEWEVEGQRYLAKARQERWEELYERKEKGEEFKGMQNFKEPEHLG